MKLLRNYFKNLLDLGGLYCFEARINKLLDDEHLVKNPTCQRIKSETDEMFQRIEQILNELNYNNPLNHQLQIGEMLQIIEQILQKTKEFFEDDEEVELVKMITYLNVEKIKHFLHQIRQIQMNARPENMPFLELIGLQGQIFRFVLYAFNVLARNIYTIDDLIFMPFCLGRVILHYMLLKESSNLNTIGVGYMIISCLFFLYFVILELIRYKRGKPLIMGSFHFYFHVFLKQIVSAMRYLMNILKVFSLVIIYFGVVPFICGWCIDPSIKIVFGESFTQKLKFFKVSPFAMLLVHSMVGYLYMIQITIFFSLLREVLRNEAVNFNGVLANPNFDMFRDIIKEPMHKHAHRVLMGSVIRLSFIVIMVFLPVKLVKWIAPDIFPLNITIYNPFTEIPIEMILYQICMPFTIRHFKSLLYYWFTIVSSALGLIEDEKQVVTKFVVLVILAWMTLIVFNTCLIVLPVSLGRALFTVISFFPIINGFKFNDVYAFITGSYLIWAIKYCIEHIRTIRARILWKNFLKWSVILVKSSVLLLIWILVIPILIGLIIEVLVIVPMRVPLDKTLYQNWSVGLIFLKICTTPMMWDHVIPLVDDTWHGKLQRVRENGFARVEFIWVVREIIVPILKKLIIALCVPYVLARGVFPVFGFALVVNSLVYRFAWLGCLGFCLMWYCVKRLIVWLSNLHNSILNERYLIGCRVHDFGEDKGETATSNYPT